MNPCALDVGAHWGEVMLDYAREHPAIPVYAFEPDVRDAARIAVALVNYHVLAVAIDEQDGIAPFYVDRVPGCSSLHRLDGDGVLDWPGGNGFAELHRLWVPTMRLDTFLRAAGVDRVLWLKIDAQGHDLAVVRSLGAYINGVDKITLEVYTTPRAQYENVPPRQEVIDVLTRNGFRLTGIVPQTDGAEENLTFER